MGSTVKAPSEWELTRDGDNEAHIRFLGKLFEIAKLLGEEWGYSDKGRAFYLKGPQFDFCLSLDRYGAGENRIEISASYPPGLRRFVRSGESSITVGFGRPAGAIAQEIQRRLMPDTVATFERVSQEKAKSDAYDEKRWSEFRAVVAALGREPCSAGLWQSDSDRQARDNYRLGRGYLKGSPLYVEIESTSDVKIEIDGLSLERALILARLVKGWADEDNKVVEE